MQLILSISDPINAGSIYDGRWTDRFKNLPEKEREAEITAALRIASNVL